MAVELPEHRQERVRELPEWRMGTHRVTLVLADGRTFSPVDIAWAKEIVRVDGSEVIPFTAGEIVEVVDASDL